MGQLANPGRGEQNRETVFFFQCPRSRLRIWSRETGLGVPSRVSAPIFRTQAESGAYSQGTSLFPFRDGDHLFSYTVIGHRVTLSPELIRSDNCEPIEFTHCRESAGTGPVRNVLIFVRSSFHVCDTTKKYEMCIANRASTKCANICTTVDVCDTQKSIGS